MKELKKKYYKLSPHLRLYGADKPIIALTGGIASGKSTAKKIIEKNGLSVIDADQIVKKIYQTQEAQDFIQKNVKEAWLNEKIDFKILRDVFFSDTNKKIMIENFIYSKIPTFFVEETTKISTQNFYIYDIPLLFEKNLEDRVDLSVLIYANQVIQKERLILRDQNSPALAQKILDHQFDIEKKRKLSDFVIDNNGNLENLTLQINSFLTQILEP